MSAPHVSLPGFIDVADIFADPEFSGASISPDGTKLAYLSPENGRKNLWVRGIDEEHDAAVCVTHDSRRGISMYHWTGDSRWLLYVQDTDGNEDWHLFRADPTAPERPAVDLTPLSPGSRVFGAESMPSSPGSVLVWMNQRPMFIDTFRIDVAAGVTTVHHEQSEPTVTVLLDREGCPAFELRPADDGVVNISAVDPISGERSLLKQMGGAEHPLGLFPQIVTPDGRSLLTGSYQDTDDLRLISIDRGTGEEAVISAVAGHSLDTSEMQAPGMLPPTVFTSRRTGEVIAARFVGDRPRIEVLDSHFAEVYAELETLSDGVLGTLSSDESEKRWVATFVHDRDPAVSWFYDHTTGDSRQLFKA